jgi:hypothetical protein
MEPFWKQLCEVRLLPLTTPFEHEMNKLRDTKIYKHEEIPFDSKYPNAEMENLCLRLTQNF